MSQPRQEFHDDGTPRRKYEFEEREESRTGLHAAVGLALASGIMLMRNFLFGGAVDARGGPQSEVATPVAGAVKEDDMAAFSGEEHQEDEAQTGGEANEGDATSLPNVTLSSSLTPIRIYDGPLASAVRLRSSGLAPSANNDNERLYGAARGERIDLSQFESSFGTDWSKFRDRGSDDGPPPQPDDDNEPTPTRVNRLPVLTAPVVLAGLSMNQSTLIAASELLRNASDPDGDALRIQGLSASSGQLVARGDGLYAFMPVLGDTSSVTLTYQVSDGTGAVAQVAHLDLLPLTPASRFGTEDDDTIVGTPAADIIDGLGGNDRILGREGDDTIHGGAGNDILLGGDGHDVIHGGSGNDVIYGGAGNDRLFGGVGEDILLGEDGDDVLFGEAGNDHLFGGRGTDTLFGGLGNDVLDAGGGDDRVFGEEGDDTILASSGDGDDYYDGGDGVDTYDTSSVPTNIVVDLVSGTASGDAIGEDTLSGIENVVAGSGNDAITGNAADNTLTGGAGDDGVSGGGGDDIIVATAGDGNDQYAGGDGSDTYDASAIQTDVTIDLAAGTASGTDIGEDAVSDIENIVAGSGNDTIIGDAADNTLTGGAGDDDVSGGAGNDVILASLGDGNDSYNGGEGTDTYDSSAVDTDVTVDLEAGTAAGSSTGEDTLTGIENVIAGGGDDVIVANDDVNELSGGAGNDVFVFRSSHSIGRGPGYRDKILDFEVGDRIDLDDISDEFEDAVEDHFEDHDIKKFVLIGQQDEFSRPGQIRFKYDEVEGKAVTVIQGNIDYDQDVEFELELRGTYTLRSEQFET